MDPNIFGLYEGAVTYEITELISQQSTNSNTPTEQTLLASNSVTLQDLFQDLNHVYFNTSVIPAIYKFKVSASIMDIKVNYS